jgi:hypothetical protein
VIALIPATKRKLWRSSVARVSPAMTMNVGSVISSFVLLGLCSKLERQANPYLRFRSLRCHVIFVIIRLERYLSCERDNFEMRVPLRYIPFQDQGPLNSLSLRRCLDPKLCGDVRDPRKFHLDPLLGSQPRSTGR